MAESPDRQRIRHPEKSHEIPRGTSSDSIIGENGTAKTGCADQR
ncbi:MAG: hypothetical protein ACJASS_001931 [Sulfitobacter sp.]|jgi:hypothetical protein